VDTATTSSARGPQQVHQPFCALVCSLIKRTEVGTVPHVLVGQISDRSHVKCMVSQHTVNPGVWANPVVSVRAPLPGWQIRGGFISREAYSRAQRWFKLSDSL
jgi:hypothetical protein